MAQRVALPSLLLVLLLALLASLAGALLPRRVEVVRSAHLAASPGAVHAALRELPQGPAWCTWGPALGGALEVTASPSRGLWFDVVGEPGRLAALLLEPAGGGTRVEWHDVQHPGPNPLARLGALLGRGRVGAELEASLAGLAGQLAREGDGGGWPPEGAEPPRVVLILADDLGWELFRSAPTPNLDAMAAAGTLVTQLWTAPKCGPTRASLLTGRFHFRIGDGEIAKLHRNRSMGLDELTLPEVLGPERCACFGKWHLSTDPRHPNESGFGHFAGSLGNLNGHSYREWPKVVDGEPSTATTYATTDVTNAAIASDARFKLVSYHAPHTPIHQPPPDLTPHSTGEGTPEALVRDMVEALDTEIGRLLAAHEDAYVFFLSDNGTSSVVGGGKGSVSEQGINVPMIVRGPGVPAGAVVADLVHVVDLFATVCELWGVEAPTEDSISFVPVLRGEPGKRAWNYSCLFWEATPGRRIHAVRDREYKLVVNYDKSFDFYAMPGEVPIDLEGADEQVRGHYRFLDELRAGLR